MTLQLVRHGEEQIMCNACNADATGNALNLYYSRRFAGGALNGTAAALDICSSRPCVGNTDWRQTELHCECGCVLAV